ncbi:MAG: VanZ family protein [Christensenellaceae bacterium]|nr:VanZ family protein [Christensenellaceae bacterium]
MAFDPDFWGCIVLSLIPILILTVVFLVRRGNVWRYIFEAALAVYLIFAASYTICPIYFYGPIRESFIENGWKLRDCIYLVPFTDGISLDDLLNVVLTFPLGFLLPLVKKRFIWKHAAIAGLIFGFGVELMQLLTAAFQGFTFKYVDVSDVICNFIGTMLGWLVIAAFILLAQRLYKDTKNSSIVGYITERNVK